MGHQGISPAGNSAGAAGRLSRRRAAALIFALLLPSALPISVSASGTPTGPAASPLATVGKPFFESVATSAGRTFVARGRDQIVRLSPRGMDVRKGASTFALRFVGASSHMTVSGEERLATTVNRYVGDRAQWTQGAATYGAVRYHDMYPGIDVKYYGRSGQIEYDFEVAPGADPSMIDLHVAGGAVTLDGGDLVVSSNGEELRQEAPIAYQIIDGRRRDVPAAFRLAGDGRVQLDIGAYDAHVALIIDPAWEFGTLIGGHGIETGQGLAVDSQGFIYIGGETESLDYPTTSGSYQPTAKDTLEAFLMKLDPSGTRVVYSTYIGGHGFDAVHRNGGLAVDQHGSAYIGGFTFSPDFPTTDGAWDRVFNGPEDGFVAKFDPAGGLVYSTYIGGSGGTVEGVRSLLVDADGNAYASGATSTKDFPLKNPLDATPEGLFEGWVAKLNASGTDLLFSTYFGGNDRFLEEVQNIALSPDGDLYMAVMTDATDVRATTGAATNPGGRTILATAVDLEQMRVRWSRWVGGSANESHLSFMSSSIAVDAHGNVYAGTTTESGGVETTEGAYQREKDAGEDLLLTKLSPSGDEVYSTYVGGSAADRLNNIVVDSAGALHAVGKTFSEDIFAGAPMVPGLVARGGADGFVLKLSPSGDALAYGAVLGGPADTDSTPLSGTLAAEESTLVGVLDSHGALYATGVASSPKFPTTDGSKVHGLWDAYVVKINP